MTNKDISKEDSWKSTTWAGNEEAHLDQVLSSSYEARFKWLCEAYEMMKGLLPNRYKEPNQNKS
jgi:hypothetical protein